MGGEGSAALDELCVDLGVCLPSADRARLRNAPPLDPDAFTDAAPWTDEVWIVWRQDDNGNHFEVARRGARAEAEVLAAEFDARGHRQTYWVAAAGFTG